MGFSSDGRFPVPVSDSASEPAELQKLRGELKEKDERINALEEEKGVLDKEGKELQNKVSESEFEVWSQLCGIADILDEILGASDHPLLSRRAKRLSEELRAQAQRIASGKQERLDSRLLSALSMTAQ